MTKRVLSAVLSLATAICVPALAAAQEQPRPTHEFRILLLQATQGEPAIPELHPEAMAALEDARGVLAYNHFEPIDTGWVRTDASAEVRLGDAGAYRAALFVNPATSTVEQIQVQFELHHTRVERDDADRPFLVSDPRRILVTSFGIRVGETVLVGTSRAEAANEALVVLLQAVR